MRAAIMTREIARNEHMDYCEIARHMRTAFARARVRGRVARLCACHTTHAPPAHAARARADLFLARELHALER